MSTITTLASGQITAVDTLIIELVEADETPAVVIIRWPDKPTRPASAKVPDVAATIAQLFAQAHVVLAAIRAEQRL